jgi:two-component system phosphate regulon sensor histidine kinase PhoR
VEEILDLENILEDVRFTLAPQIKEAQAVIKTEIGHSEITFARRKLRSIIYNLVNNALKYKSPDRRSEIFIKSYLDEGCMVISITDNGIGISLEDQGAIFKKYRRVKSSVEGNGIGLYLVKEILENSGGKVIVESALDKGSTFKVFIQLNEDPNVI